MIFPTASSRARLRAAIARGARAVRRDRRARQRAIDRARVRPRYDVSRDVADRRTAVDRSIRVVFVARASRRVVVAGAPVVRAS